MPLCTPIELLNRAKKENRVIAGFNVGNMEMLRGIVEASEEASTPVILQIAEKRLPASPLHLLAPMMVSAARQAKTDIAVMLDHGESLEVIRQALDYGFSGVMFDGSSLALSENIEETQAVKRMAEKYGASVEAELGVLSGSEGGPEAQALYTDPGEAYIFARESGCDALAVSIGNAHGHYKGKPKLNFHILNEIAQKVTIPLVLHGGSGIPAEDFARAATMGICKINIATANFDAVAEGAKKALKRCPDADYFELSGAMAGQVRQTALEHIKIFSGLTKI